MTSIRHSESFFFGSESIFDSHFCSSVDGLTARIPTTLHFSTHQSWGSIFAHHKMWYKYRQYASLNEEPVVWSKLLIGISKEKSYLLQGFARSMKLSTFWWSWYRSSIPIHVKKNSRRLRASLPMHSRSKGTCEDCRFFFVGDGCYGQYIVNTLVFDSHKENGWPFSTILVVFNSLL